MLSLNLSEKGISFKSGFVQELEELVLLSCSSY